MRCPFLFGPNDMTEDIRKKEEVHWFPMRVTYNRELKVKEHLDELNIENFLPMRYELVEIGGARKRQLVPAIHNLIFVHTTQSILTDLKQSKRELQSLRYITRPSTVDGSNEIIRVPYRQMDNFIRVASVQDDSVIFLNIDDNLKRMGTRVKILEGPFAGVEGVVKRISKNKHVVVHVEGLAAVAITFVPPRFLSVIT